MMNQAPQLNLRFSHNDKMLSTENFNPIKWNFDLLTGKLLKD